MLLMCVLTVASLMKRRGAISWVAALMLEAIAMIGVRTLVIMGRSVMVAKRLPAMSAL